MEVIAHRGWWRVPEEKNTREALDRAFAQGFGVETDLRDLDGRVVVSHDPPRRGALDLEDLLALHDRAGRTTTLALNVKADGLLPLLDEQAPDLASRKHFFFDMSVPDMLSYVRAERRVFTRRSEIETAPALLDACDGVWLDAFDGDWFTTDDVRALLDAGKQVCVVSPELHGRPHRVLWQDVLVPLVHVPGLSICTDHPQEAAEVLAS